MRLAFVHNSFMPGVPPAEQFVPRQGAEASVPHQSVPPLETPAAASVKRVNIFKRLLSVFKRRPKKAEGPAVGGMGVAEATPSSWNGPKVAPYEIPTYKKKVTSDGSPITAATGEAASSADKVVPTAPPQADKKAA